MNSTLKEKNESLNKWKKVCITMGAKEDIDIIEDIIKVINNNDNTSVVKAKNKNLDDVEEILELYYKKDYVKLNKAKLLFLKIDIDIIKEWDKLSEKAKEVLSKKELNVIYNLIYRPKEIKFINKTKKDIVHDINYYINNEKRNSALIESKLI